jgi:hypothetical protein
MTAKVGCGAGKQDVRSLESGELFQVRRERDLDALVTQEMDQPTGRVSFNPERAKPKAQLANLRAQLREAHEQHSRQSLGSEPTSRSSDAVFAVQVQTIEADIVRVQTSTARFRPACPGAPPVRAAMPCSLVSKSAA